MSVWVGDKKIVLQKPIQNFFKFIKKKKEKRGETGWNKKMLFQKTHAKQCSTKR